MTYSVVATAFPGRVEHTYPYEHEALRPLGITITTVDADSDSAYLAQIKQADAIMVGGRRLSADIIAQLERCKVIANGGIGVDRVDLDAATAKGIVVTNVPDVFIDEVASGLTKAERQKLIHVGQAASLYAQVMKEPVAFLPHLPLVTRAIDISSRTRSGYYDCLYVALAEREGCQLITADQKSVNNLAPHFPFIVLLASLP